MELSLAMGFQRLSAENFFIGISEAAVQSDVFLKRLFKRTTGMTMREWRKSSAAGRANGSAPQG